MANSPRSNGYMEPYARAKLSVGVRRVLAGLRAGCLPLQVEVGRYAYPKKSRSMKDYASCVVKALKIKHIYYYNAVNSAMLGVLFSGQSLRQMMTSCRTQ